MEKSTEIGKLAAALVAVQLEMPTVKKDSVNPFFKSKYADLATVLQALLPVLTKNGLCIVQQVSNLDGDTALTTTLMHISGEYISATRPLILPKADPQGQGSAITYARRYDAMAIIGMVADKDDDGNKATVSLEDLAESKKDMVNALKKNGMEVFSEQIDYVEKVIGKRTIDDPKEAEQVIKSLKEKK